MYFLPLWCSFISFMVTACLGRHLGSRGVFIFSICCISVCSMSSLLIFYEVCLCHSTCYIKCFDWLRIDLISIQWGFVFDSLSSSMLVVINIVSVCAHVYSVEYMRSDPHTNRFFSYLSLFTFFMIFLVLSDNLLQLFMGWEGVGICSYLLINFWATRIQANKASLLAVITNKLGDIALLLCCAMVYTLFKTLDFSILNSCIETIYTNIFEFYDPSGYKPRGYYADLHSGWTFCSKEVLEAQRRLHLMEWIWSLEWASELLEFDYSAICFFLIIAAVGKSAQAGLHIWLPEAMEGPTPVSSLIHAATMVTAGIFLLVRSSYFFTEMNSLFVCLILFGSITAFFSSTIGLLQTDIKKVIAYSTCSQLGYMFICCGFSAYNNSMFHLFNHAFFKALLFLTAGYVIHALNNEQDIRKMGSILKLLPFSYIMMLIGSLSLIGFPFFSGFYSKDKIIELCFNNYFYSLDLFFTYKYIIFSQILCILAVIFTLIYSTKLVLYIFLNSYNGFKKTIGNIHYSSFFIQIPLLFLSFLSILSGYVTSDMMVGVGTTFWSKSFFMDTFFFSVFKCAKYSFLLHTEYNDYIRHITLAWTLYFLFTSVIIVTHFKYFIYYSVIGSLVWFKQLFVMINKKYLFINRLFTVELVNKFFLFSYSVTYTLFDKGFIEFMGPFGIVSSIKNMLYSQYKLQSGLIYHYAGFLFLMLILFIHFFFDFLYK